MRSLALGKALMAGMVPGLALGPAGGLQVPASDVQKGCMSR